MSACGKKWCDPIIRHLNHNKKDVRLTFQKETSYKGRLLIIYCYCVKTAYCIRFICNKYYPKKVFLLANSSRVVIVLHRYCTIYLSTICISGSLLKWISESSCLLPVLSSSITPFSDIEFAMSGAKRKLPILASTMEVSSWKDNPIDTLTKIMVGVMP